MGTSSNRCSMPSECRGCRQRKNVLFIPDAQGQQGLSLPSKDTSPTGFQSLDSQAVTDVIDRSINQRSTLQGPLSFSNAVGPLSNSPVGLRSISPTAARENFDHWTQLHSADTGPTSRSALLWIPEGLSGSLGTWQTTTKDLASKKLAANLD